MRVIPSRIHGITDYSFALVLIVLPFVLGYEKTSVEAGVLIMSGGLIIALNLITGYEGGIIKMISMRGHLWVDFILGALLVASPWIFGFSGHTYLPFVIMGTIDMIVAVITSATPGASPTRTGSRKHTTDIFNAERLNSHKQDIAEAQQ